jgi:lysozyme
MMKKLYIFLAICIALMVVGDAYAQRSKRSKRRTRQKTQKVVKSKKKKTNAKKTYVVKPAPIVNMEDSDYNPYLMCEDTCGHVHGIDLSHYQGEVFWETVGENTKMAYVYLKATEGGDRIDAKYERNIELAHRYGLKVGSYHFFRPKTPLDKQLQNFMTQCLPGEQDLIPMIDVETTANLSTEEFCDSLMTFLGMIEKAYHQKPLVYTFRNFYNRHLVGKLNDYQLMIAMYTEEEPVLVDERDITLWQYTGKGRIVGVNGFVDKSRFMGRHGLREIRFRH